MAYSEARNRATKKYVKNNYYTVKTYIPKEMEQVLKNASGGSVSDFVRKAIYESLKQKGYDVPNS